MSKKLLLTLAAFFAMSAAFAQPGFTCANPIGIALPYSTTDSTANYGDTTDPIPYMDGNDVFYSFTPAISGNISIVMDPASGYSSVALYVGCNIAAGSYIVNQANSGTGPRVFESIPVTAGVVYTIVISTDDHAQTVDYSLVVQNFTCLRPTQLSVGDLGQTTAELYWNNPANATDFEVMVQSPGSGMPTGSGVAVTGAAYNVSGLDSASTYEYWVRSNCGNGTFSIWYGPKTFTTYASNSLCPTSNQCDYIFNTVDTFGDGWNGNSMTVSQNGNIVAVLAMDQPGLFNEMQPVPLCTDQPFELFWNAGGNFPTEVVVNIINPHGQVIYTKPYNIGTQDSLLYSGIADCDWIEFIPFIDTNTNGVMDANEATFTHGSFAYQLNDSGPILFATPAAGNYFLHDGNPSNSYDFTYQIDSAFDAYYTMPTLVYSNLTIPAGSGAQILYFPINLTAQPFSNVSVTVLPTQPPRPNSNYISTIQITNQDTAPVSGTLSFTYDPLVSLFSVSQAGTVPTINGFTYDYTLSGNEIKNIYVALAVPNSPIVNLGDFLTNSATITSPGDIFLSDNSSSLTQEVVNSFDPNDKSESHGGQIPINTFSADDYLIYTIRFQNLGTANAIDVRIEDVLDDKLDEESIRMISASHDYVMERSGNNVTWKFDYIQLPPSSQNEELSKGYVTFKIKPNPGFAVGDEIRNTASIYFDSNPAIETNECVTTFTPELGNPRFDNTHISLYPNPANKTVYINIENANQQLEKITLLDMVGKTVCSSKSIGSAQTAIDISALAKGVYLMEIETSAGNRILKKLIKE